MRRLTSLWGAAVLAACASAPATRPEAPATRAAPTATAAEASLESAWDQPQAVAPVPAAVPVTARADRRAPFKQALTQAAAHLKAGRLDDARASAQVARTEAEGLGGEERFQAGQLAFRVELAADSTLEAQSAALDWRHACGPEKVDTCRTAAVAALAQVARRKDAPRPLAKLATALKEADACAAKAERTATLPACVAEAETTARGTNDDVLGARLLLARGLSEKQEARQRAALERAEAQCTTAPCSGVRRRALAKLSALAVARGDLEAAVRYGLRDVAVVQGSLPKEERPWARTRELEALCAKYDAAKTPGACRALEKQTTSGWTFLDFSREHAGDGLSPEKVRAVNEHYAPLLQQCLAEQARRMTPPDAQRFDVRWTVLNDGRVGEAHLRKDLDETPLAKCLRAQFTAWRYPRYDGEFQHVEQQFTVTAQERRPTR